MKHKLPKTLPGDWLAALKMPSCEGSYEGFVVVRASKEKNAYDPFMVHRAYYMDEGADRGWHYVQGDYCKTLPEALRSFAKRSMLAEFSA
jgi:hypothetical protein